jgi:hypothetical protein
MLSPAILENFLSDTRDLARSLIVYGDRWTRYGKSLEKHMSDSQRAEVKQALDDLTFAVDQLAEGDEQEGASDNG